MELKATHGSFKAEATPASGPHLPSTAAWAISMLHSDATSLEFSPDASPDSTSFPYELPCELSSFDCFYLDFRVLCPDETVTLDQWN